MSLKYIHHVILAFITIDLVLVVVWISLHPLKGMVSQIYDEYERKYSADNDGRSTDNRKFNMGFPPLEISTRPPDQAKIILAWNSFFNKKDFGAGGFGKEPFLKCPVSDCFLTDNKTYLSQATSLLFHVLWNVTFPLKRDPRQLYVFYLREALGRLPNRHQQCNLTMTYTLDLDIPTPIGKVYRKATENSTYELKFPFADRTRVVSHCRSGSKRELYVKELQRHIEVDIFGGCGNRTFCGIARDNKDKCFTAKIPSMYKFYLSFENKICQDYATEKLFRPLVTEIVPVVYGGTNYSRDAPPHSYINIQDYSSPKELANYLKRLAANETEYKQYFEWKKTHIVRTHGDPLAPIPMAFCKLCDVINRPSFHKTYTDMLSWWSPKMCKKPTFVLKQTAEL